MATEKFDFQEAGEGSVEIPAELLRSFEDRNQEMADPDISRERWDELNKEHRARMTGDSNEDLYYQLYTYRSMTAQGDDGIKSRITELEKALGERK